MEISERYRLAQHVHYDDYDGYGYLLDIRQGVLEELSEEETHLLTTVLSTTTGVGEAHVLSQQIGGQHLATDIITPLLNQLQRQGFLEVQRSNCPVEPSFSVEAYSAAAHPLSTITFQQRMASAGHMVFVLNELRQEGDGLYKAYLYIHKLKAMMTMLSTEASLQVIREEYWFYRLVTGIFERKIAHLLGQIPGEEGLCMVRAFSLCAFLLILGVPVSVVIGRPKYGSRSGFKIHVWVELSGKPLNEVANIRDRYRVLSVFPSYS